VRAPEARAVQIGMLAELSRGEVWVLHLREQEVAGRGGLMMREAPDEAREVVEAAASELTRARVKAHGEVRATIYGYAAREIIDDAKGSRRAGYRRGLAGRGDLAGLVLGSTAHKVIQLSDWPVLVVR